MGEQIELLKLEERTASEAPEPVPIEQLKLRKPNRQQLTYAPIEVDQLVSEADPVRAIWELTGRLDLSRFAARLRTRKNDSGREAWDPRLLVAIWIWAYAEGLSSAREIERQCRYRPALQWLCGMERINHPSLSDFRAENSEALDNVFTQVLAALSRAELIELQQVAVDGTRVRSQGATSSQRRRRTIERHLEQARATVRRMNEQAEDEETTTRKAAAKPRAAREQVERAEQALDELQQIEAKKKPSQQKAARASATEPEARLQRESNGGWGLGYNAQLATDAKKTVVVGVELTNNASDQQQLEPTLEDVKRRMERAPEQVLADEGYNSRANLEAMEEAGIEYLTPLPEAGKGSQSAARAAGIRAEFASKFFIWDEATDTFRCPAGKTLKYRRTSRKKSGKYRQYQGQASDCRECEFRERCCPKSGRRTVSRSEKSAVIARQRKRMESERSKAAYKKRSQTAEFPNAWLKERFGLRKFRLKGLSKARAELLWAVLAYNVRIWIRLVWKPELAPAVAA